MKGDGRYQQIIPESDVLKKNIKPESWVDDFEECITYYPNYVTTINIYKNSKVTYDAYSRKHEFKESPEFLQLLVRKFDLSRQIITKGRSNKLTIVFNPLGINHFIDGPLSLISKDHFSFLDAFRDEFISTLNIVFEAGSIEEKRDFLDHFLEKKLTQFKEDRLELAVKP